MRQRIEALVRWLEGWGLHVERIAIIAFGIGTALLIIAGQGLLFDVFRALLFLVPVLGPPLALYGVISWWLAYVRLRFLLENEMVLVEIVMPQEVRRTPRAMQAFFEALYKPFGEATFIDRFFRGKMRPFWSFEIVAHGGVIRFYCYLRKSLRENFEALLYAYYPEVVVREVEDYTRRFPYNEQRENLFGFHFFLAKPDVYPLRTFVDFRTDDPFMKPEERVDPLSVVLEQLADVGKDEQVWLQIVVRSHKPKERDLTSLFKRETEAILEEYHTKDNEGKPDYGKLPPYAVDLLKAMRRKLEQHHFQVGMRLIYKAKKEAFTGPRIPLFVNLLHIFSSQLYNSFTLGGWLAEYNYPWQDPTGYRQAFDKRRLFYLYQRRAWFTPYYWEDYFVLSSEELATLFHPIGSDVLGQRVSRVAARRVEPPAQLPEASSVVEDRGAHTA